MNSDFLPRRGQGQDKNSHKHSEWERPATFRTPEEVAANDDKQPNDVQMNESEGFVGHHKPPKKSFKERLKNLSKKQWAIIIAVAFIVIAGISFGTFMLLG